MTAHSNNAYPITEQNRPHILEWLKDRAATHVWFSILITGSFFILNAFDTAADFQTPGGTLLGIALLLFLFALMCNLICVWSIPSWKYKVATGIVTDSVRMRNELRITGWLGIIAFICGLNLIVIANVVT